MTKQTSAPSNRVAHWRARLPKLDFYEWLLLGAIAFYVVVFTQLAFEIHAGMRTHKADLGQFDQAIWNSSRGRFLEQTDGGGISTRMTDHVEPILALISPIYWFWDDVRAILLLQVLFVAVGAWLLYRLALHRLDRALPPSERTYIWRWEPLRNLTRPLALALALAFLFAPQLQSAVLTEFHAVPLSVPLILWALWAAERARWRQFAAAVILVALVKEEMALVAFMLGLWGVWRGYWMSRESGDSTHVRNGALWGGALAVLSLAWFAVATFIIVPHFAGPFYGSDQSTYFARYGALGDSPVDIAKSFITQPQLVWQIATEPARLVYLWRLLAIFGLFALLAPELILLSLPILLANLLSAYPAQFYGEFHYSAPVVPFFAAAAAFGLARAWAVFWRRSGATSASFQHMPAASAGTMALASFATNPAAAVRPIVSLLVIAWLLGWAGWTYAQAGRAWLGGRYDPTPITEHHQLLPRFVAQVPPDVPLTATAAVHPHVSHRQFIYQFPDGFAVDVPATWALLDVTTNTDMAPGDLKATVNAMLAGEWGVVDAADGFLLLAQGAPDEVIPEAFYSFTRVAEDATAPPATITAEDWSRWRQTKLVVEWREWNPAAGEPRLDVHATSGDLLYTLNSAAPPVLVWRPWQEWQSGDDLRVTTLWLNLPRAVRVTDGTGEGDVIFYRGEDERLRSLPTEELMTGNELAETLSTVTNGELLQDQLSLLADNAPVDLRVAIPNRRFGAGDSIDIWTEIEADTWPAGWSFYVHLNRGRMTVVQQDGPPNFFGVIDADAELSSRGITTDWRTVTIPADELVGDVWTLEIGLYNAATGARATAPGSPRQAIAFPITVTSGTPDQTCALNAAACASQPRNYPR